VPGQGPAGAQGLVSRSRPSGSLAGKAAKPSSCWWSAQRRTRASRKKNGPTYVMQAPKRGKLAKKPEASGPRIT